MQDDTDDKLEDKIPARALAPHERKAMFLQVDEVTDQIEDLRRQIAELEALRSDRVQAIYDKIGRGPFLFEGRKIEIGRRNSRYYFKEFKRTGAEAV